MRANKGFDGRSMTQEEVDKVLDWKNYPGIDGGHHRFTDMEEIVERLWYEVKYRRAILNSPDK